MLSEAMTALAAAGGTAVVQAAGTDAWTGFRQRAARWFGQGNPQRENAELERLDQTASDLQMAETAEPTEAERVRMRQEALWQARIEVLLESLDGAERARAAETLGALLDQQVSKGGVSADRGGQAIGGNVHIEARDNSAAAWTMGEVNLGNPARPGPSQG